MSQSIPLSDLESSPAAKFEHVGDKHVGTIIAMNERQQTDINGKPLFFDSGDPRMLWVITIRNPAGDNITLWAKGGNYEVAEGQGTSMLTAIGQAVRAAGAESVDVGAQLAVAHTGLGKAQPGLSAPKLYTAQYQPPAPETPSVAVDDLFN